MPPFFMPITPASKPGMTSALPTVKEKDPSSKVEPSTSVPLYLTVIFCPFATALPVPTFLSVLTTVFSSPLLMNPRSSTSKYKSEFAGIGPFASAP